MSNAFTRGLRILFGIKRKRRLAPEGSLVRPVLFNEKLESSEIQPVVLETPKNKPVRKKVSKKKVVRKKSVSKKKVTKKKSTKKKVIKK